VSRVWRKPRVLYQCEQDQQHHKLQPVKIVYKAEQETVQVCNRCSIVFRWGSGLQQLSMVEDKQLTKIFREDMMFRKLHIIWTGARVDLLLDQVAGTLLKASGQTSVHFDSSVRRA